MYNYTDTYVTMVGVYTFLHLCSVTLAAYLYMIVSGRFLRRTAFREEKGKMFSMLAELANGLLYVDRPPQRPYIDIIAAANLVSITVWDAALTDIMTDDAESRIVSNPNSQIASDADSRIMSDADSRIASPEESHVKNGEETNADTDVKE